MSKQERMMTGISAEVGKQAARRAQEFLEKHSDIIDPAQIKAVKKREASSAQQAYLEHRRVGRANENSSEKPGITLFVTTEGKDRAVQTCQKEGYSISAHQITSAPNDVWVLRFPKGVYSMGWGGAQFYQEGIGDSLQKSKKPFSLGYEEVVRVEGDSGELWQNWDYEWDGKPKK